MYGGVNFVMPAGRGSGSDLNPGGVEYTAETQPAYLDLDLEHIDVCGVQGRVMSADLLSCLVHQVRATARAPSSPPTLRLR